MFRPDPWLSSVLDVSCFRGDDVALASSAQAIRAELARCASDGAAFVSVKQPCENIAAVERFVQAGFNVVDVGVTLAHNGDMVSETDEETIELANDSDETQIADLAGRCFTRSRFHADARIGTSRANAVKREWARNACRGRAAAVYVARRLGAVAGFLAVMTHKHSGGYDAVIDLIGVDAAHQGNGIGHALSRRFIRDWRRRADRLLVGTQAANIPAIRLYESLGFRTHETSYALHAHPGDGRVGP